MTTQPVTSAFNPNEARDPTGKWTAGGGSAQARALEAQRKTTAPKAAAPGKVLVHKPYHSPGGGGGGGAGGGGGKAGAKKAAAAKKATIKKAAAAKKTAARAAAAQQTKALRARVAQTEAAWRAQEKAKHQQFMDAYQQSALEEQQRLAMWQQSIANMPAGMASGARKAAAARHAEWLAAHRAAYSGEQRRHIAATAKITKAVAALNAQRDAQITLTKANRDQAIARLNAQATAAVNAIKASVALTADATAHTRTPDALARYWLHGPGAAKIRWGEGNDWYRCVAQLGKYVHNPNVVKGQCNSLHKLAIGLWPATHDKILHGG